MGIAASGKGVSLKNCKVVICAGGEDKTTMMVGKLLDIFSENIGERLGGSEEFMLGQ